MIRQPKLGETVIYVYDADEPKPNGAPEAPAIVVRVWPPAPGQTAMVNLRVLPDLNNHFDTLGVGSAYHQNAPTAKPTGRFWLFIDEPRRAVPAPDAVAFGVTPLRPQDLPQG